jgi:predicted amidohydrolase
MYIAFGWTKDTIDEVNEQDNNANKSTSTKTKAENHYTVITPSGEIISDYTKIHPFSYANEDQFFHAGEQISQFQINDFTASTFICYDLRFPEIFQAASEKAQLIIVAANWPEARREHWRCLMRARAIENQVYMVGVNCVGEIGSTKYAGDSCIIDPQGNVLAELSYQEGLLIYDIKNDVAHYRKEFPVKQDRKLNIYKKYYSN